MIRTIYSALQHFINNTDKANISRRNWLLSTVSATLLPNLLQAKQNSFTKEDYINVKDFGAKGNGKTNDTKAIQYCFDNFSKIYFPTGVYLTESLKLPGNKFILGDGGYLSELKNITSFENHYINSDKVSNITIDSMYLNGNKDNRLPKGKKAKEGSTYQFSNTEIVYEPRQNNIIIKNCIVSGNGFNNLGSINTHGVLIDSCQFINGRDSGVAATQGCSKWIVSNCTFDDTLIFPISFSNIGVEPDTYKVVGRARDITITNNTITVGTNVNTKGLVIPGMGIELDGCRNVMVEKNHITIRTGNYGIRIIPSDSKTQIFDCNNIDIIDNTIINQNTGNVSGIEIFNDTKDTEPKFINVTNNTIQNEVISSLVGIYCYNINSLSIENNKIKSIIKSGNKQPNYKTGITIDTNYKTEVSIINNDITGGAWAGVQCGDLKNKVLQKITLTNNKVYDNNINIGVGDGWEVIANNNYTPGPNYLTPSALHGDIKHYSSAPTKGTWKLNERVYNKNPAAGSYTGWVCVQAGTPGKWKGFGYIKR